MLCANEARLLAEIKNLKTQIDALTAWLASSNIGTAPGGGGPVVGITDVGGASAAEAVAAVTISGGIGQFGNASAPLT